MSISETDSIIDLDHYVPAMIQIIANKLTASASKCYRDQFGIGTLEWRIFGMVAFKPEQPVARLADLTGFDKAAVSRGLNSLLKKDLVNFKADKADPRRKTWTLSSPGKKLYKEISNAALEREAKLVSGLSDKEKQLYVELTRKMIRNVEKLL